MQQQDSHPVEASVNIDPPSYSEIPGTVPFNGGIEGAPPPSYDDVVDPEASPPSYQSLFGQVREARKNSNNVLDYLRKVILLLLGTIGCSILLGITVVIPISMVIIGTQYFGDCPVEQFIPVYLIVGGAFGIFKNVLGYCSKCRKSDEDEQDQLVHRSRDSIINCFLMAWFITGCVWTYRVYEPEYEDEMSPFYCNKTLYLFTFWLLTASFILTGIFAILCSCFLVSSVIASIE